METLAQLFTNLPQPTAPILAPTPLTLPPDSRSRNVSAPLEIWQIFPL